MANGKVPRTRSNAFAEPRTWPKISMVEMLHLAFELDRRAIERGDTPPGYTISAARARLNRKLARISGAALIPRRGAKLRLAYVSPEAPTEARAISRVRRRQRRWRCANA